MNVLTFDIEEWYIESVYKGGRKEQYAKFDNLLGTVLDALDEKNLKATFFCLGRMATDFPYVVKSIYERGHEIGCHSDRHIWLTKMSADALREDTKRAVHSLENCVGCKVVSYRAPAFSISESNKWALEILAEVGIERDASIFPAVRDFGGFASFPNSTPSIVTCNNISVKEFPVSVVSLLGKDMVCSGGGYFRLFPYSFIVKKMIESDYSMTYFHIGDLLSDTHKLLSRQAYEEYFMEDGAFTNRLKRYIKSNVGVKNTLNKFAKLLNSMRFYSLAEADIAIDWTSVPLIIL